MCQALLTAASVSQSEKTFCAVETFAHDFHPEALNEFSPDIWSEPITEH